MTKVAQAGRCIIPPMISERMQRRLERFLDCDEPGDHETAIELQDEALAITQELGMRPLTERILRGGRYCWRRLPSGGL